MARYLLVGRACGCPRPSSLLRCAVGRRTRRPAARWRAPRALYTVGDDHVRRFNNDRVLLHLADGGRVVVVENVCCGGNAGEIQLRERLHLLRGREILRARVNERVPLGQLGDV